MKRKQQQITREQFIGELAVLTEEASEASVEFWRTVNKLWELKTDTEIVEPDTGTPSEFNTRQFPSILSEAIGECQKTAGASMTALGDLNRLMKFLMFEEE